MLIFEAIVIIVVSYLIGSIPTGYLIVKAKTGQDIRKIGSGSTGATNVKRVLGKEWFFVTLLFDANKGAIPVILFMILYGGHFNYGMAPILAAISVLVGHSKSVFLNFSGGKSVAAASGTLLAINPLAGVILFAVWGLITWFSRYVSLGSIIAVGLSPFVMMVLKQPVSYVLYCAVGAVYIIWLHRENIKRLLKGEENKVR